MAVDFTKPDGFDPAKGYKRIKFGEDGGITESELSELQKIQDQRLRDTMEAFIGRVTALLSGTITFNGSTLTATSLVGFLDGELFQYSGNIALVNNDRVYVEILESEITYAQDPAILDSRMGEETTRRIKNTYSLKKTNTGAGNYFELGQIVSGIFVETAGRITPYADLGTDDINVIASKPSATLLSAYPNGFTVFKYLTGDAGYPVTNSSIMTVNNAQGTDGFQVLYGYVSSKPVQYVRYFTGTAWGAWEKFATTADLTAHANDAVAHITATERTKWNDGQLQKLTELGGYSLSANNVDINTLKTTGFFYGSGLTNAPAGTAGWIVVHSVTPSYVVQEFTVNTSSALGVRRFWRVFFNGTWLSWNEYALNATATQSSNGLMSSLDKIALDSAQKFRLTKDSGEVQYPANNADFNTLNATGYYAFIGTNGHTGAPNAWGYWFVHVVQYDTNTGFQRWERTDTGDTHYRVRKNGVWGDFRKFINSLEMGNIVSGGNFVELSSSDFNGKTANNMSVPNIARWDYNPVLTNPTSYLEIIQSEYNALYSLGGSVFAVSNGTSGNVAQVKFSFSLIDHVQKLYGTIPGVTVADKVLWLKNNISKIFFNWWGFGASPTGNKANFTVWNANLSAWFSGVGVSSHTSATVSKISTSSAFYATVANLIDANGNVHLCAYAEPANGTTPSSITTDYVSIDVEISTNILNGLLDATPSTRGIMSATDKAKLDGVANNANNYAHPSTHPASIIVQDASNRFVTDAEKTSWNGKANNVVATTSANGLMSSTDKVKMDGIQAGAEVNQNAFSYMTAGGVTLQADNKIDTVAFLAGTNIALSGDAVNDTITVSVTGTVASSASTPWGGITGKPTKVEDFGITDVALRYGTTIQGGNWSRILSMTGATVFGHSFLLTIKGTRGGVVYKATLLVTTGHFRTGQITQLSNINYSDVQIRTIVDDMGNGFIEVLDNLNGIVTGTTQTVSVDVVKIQESTLSPITAYTSGATIPTNHIAQGQITTVLGKNFVGDLVGDVTGNVAGNASSATKLQTARSIALSGDATGSITFDGTGNVTIPVVVQDDSHNHVITNVDGLQTALDAKDSVTSVNGKVAQVRTDLEGYVEGYTKVAFKDTRDVNSPPSFYTGTEGRKTHFEFKDKSVIGLGTATGAWISLITHSRWSESSGGNPSQTAIDDIGEMYMRVRINDTTWSPWRKFAFDETATTSTKGLMSNTDKSKLDGIASSANNYVHPSTHPATMIVEDSSNRFVTDAEKTSWNGKANNVAVTTTVNGLMIASDKAKLDGIATSANNYVHPSTHPASIIVQDSSNRFATDAEKAIWNGKETTTGAQTKADTAQNNAIGFATSYGLGGEATLFPTNDWNNITAKTGFYNGASFANSPKGSTGWHYVVHIRHANATGYLTQIAIPFDTAGQMFFRTCSAGVWSSWSQNAILDSNGKVAIGNLALDASNRLVTDADKTNWNAKETTTGAQAKANQAEVNAENASVPRNDTRANAVDLNTYQTTGIYAIGTSGANSPAGFSYGSLLVSTSATDRMTQLAFSPGNSKLFIRYGTLSPITWGAWTELATTALATGALNGLMSSSDKSKLDGVATNANNYVHPSTHPATMITEDSGHRFITDAERTSWNGKASTAVANTFSNGLMSIQHVTALESAQKYKLMEDTGARFQYNDLNFARFEGLFYAPTGTTNSAVSFGAWVDVKVSPGGAFILQVLYANSVNKQTYVRRSTDSGSTWGGWSETGTAELDWINATLQSGHSSLSARTVKYARDGNLLYIRGAISKSGAGTLGGESNPIFTLPAGYRPSTPFYTTPAMIGTGATSNYNNRYEIQSNGVVNMAFNWNCQYYGLDIVIPLD